MRGGWCAINGIQENLCKRREGKQGSFYRDIWRPAIGGDRDTNNGLSEDGRNNLSLLSERPPRTVMESA